MRALGFPVKKEEVRRILADCDKESASRISYDDFVDVSECAHSATAPVRRPA